MKIVHSIVMLLALGGCQIIGPDLADDDSTPGSETIIIDDAGLNAAHRDPFHIDGIRIRGDALLVDVGYSGGCEEHTFELHAGLGWTLANPPGKYIVIAHDAHGDACEAYLTEQLQFDLKELRHPQSNEIVLFILPFPGDSVWTPPPRYRY